MNHVSRLFSALFKGQRSKIARAATRDVAPSPLLSEWEQGFNSGATPGLKKIQGLVSTPGILWANRPGAAANANALQWFSDIGPAGSLFKSDGANWKPLNGVALLAQSAVPVVLLPAATAITATGAITGLAALPYQPTGVVRVYVFAQTGLTAGLYYATFSSTTACQLYTDAAGTITPTGITPAAYAGGTGTAVLASINIPAGLMGVSGALRYGLYFSYPSNASNKSAQVVLGAVTFGNNTNTTGQGVSLFGTIRNRAAAVQSQMGGAVMMTTGSINQAPGQATVDTTVAQTLAIGGQISTVATDYMILEGYTVELVE